jgi:hypothetical protein
LQPSKIARKVNKKMSSDALRKQSLHHRLRQKSKARCTTCIQTDPWPHLGRDLARPCHIYTRTGLAPAASVPRLSSSCPPHPHRNRLRRAIHSLPPPLDSEQAYMQAACAGARDRPAPHFRRRPDCRPDSRPSRAPRRASWSEQAWRAERAEGERFVPRQAAQHGCDAGRRRRGEQIAS